MNEQPAQIVNLGVPSLSSQDAWSLWQRLGDLAQSLWDAYEQPFLEYCIQESEEFQRTHPIPFDFDESANTPRQEESRTQAIVAA